MAKKQSGDIRYAVNKKALKKAQAQAAQEQSRQQQRAEDREKSRRMGSVFLLSVLSLIALFCLYTLIRTLCFPGAASLEELRSNLLFVSVAAIPYLLGFGAVLVHRLLKSRREHWSERSKKLGTALMILCVAAAFLLFGCQLRSARQDASRDAAYLQTVAALEQSGLPVTKPDSVECARTLLEYALRTELRCGESSLRLNVHRGSDWITARFLNQAAADYGACPLTETEGLRRWGPVGQGGTALAALAKEENGAVVILELIGPQAELETLLPLLAAALG